MAEEDIVTGTRFMETPPHSVQEVGWRGRLVRHRRLVVAACLLLYLLQAVGSMMQKSNVFDEISHFGSGYMALFGGSLKFDEHPMFSKLVACLPLLVWHDRLKHPAELESFQRGDAWNASYDLLYHNTVDAETILHAVRLPGILWGLLLGVVVYLFARDLYGVPAGLLAVFLFALCPNLIAHARWLTLDFPVTVFIACACYFFYRGVTTFAWQWVALCAAFTGMAVATKISACILVPIFLTLLALHILCASDVVVHVRLGPLARWLARRRPLVRKLAALLALGLASGLLVWFVVWAAYGFRYEAAPPDSPLYPLRLPNRAAPGLAHAMVRVAWDQRLLPQHFLCAMQNVMVHMQRGHLSYLNGKYSITGWWYFFPVVMAIKTPIPVLLLGAAAAVGSVLGWRRTPGARRRAELFVAVPPVIFLAVAMSGNLSMGLRHILPVYPFLIVFAAKACTLPFPAGRGPRFALGLLCVWMALGSLRIYPHYLAYFNEFIGGPRQGHRYLVDSNLDWGQDLKGLKRHMDRHGIETVKLSYFGTADPNYYGIDYTALPSYTIRDPLRVAVDEDFKGVYAVSATMLSGLYLRDMPEYVHFMNFLRDRMVPIGHVGYSIYLYRLLEEP